MLVAVTRVPRCFLVANPNYQNRLKWLNWLIIRKVTFWSFFLSLFSSLFVSFFLPFIRSFVRSFILTFLSCPVLTEKIQTSSTSTVCWQSESRPQSQWVVTQPGRLTTSGVDTLQWTWQLTSRDCGYYGLVLETAGNCTHPKLMFSKTSSLKLGHCTLVST